jgi:cellulose biosynthesis protein BcsQ
VGKTTTSINLGFIRALEKKVLLIDADLIVWFRYRCETVEIGSYQILEHNNTRRNVNNLFCTKCVGYSAHIDLIY